ncbi:alpha/beta fold hydrolase [Enterococcus hulanensis]|uniref:alpha/beta fold hydrolase n=1 Tax=Enterococcus hulanensis TaxID=2559929 RepID=UPI00289003F3|nr:alpha/beta fold hydrolase [Enterococcus hulanensis]MDT2659728.1 alpha/beta fold hydrolase [Enterococcus hulanensis]
MMVEKFELLSVDQKTPLQAYQWSCENPWAVLQVTHGMAEHLMRYEPLANYLNERKIAVIGHDHLGHGASVSENPKGYFHDETLKHGLVQDLYQVTKWGKARYPNLPYFVLGHSMGSFVLRNYLYDYGEAIDGAILMGTGQQPVWLTRFGQKSAKLLGKLQGEKHHSKLIDQLAFGNMNRKIPKKRTDKDWLTTLSKEVDAYLADPNCGFLFTLSGYHELFSLIIRTQEPELLQKVPKKLPLLFLSGQEDPVGEYGKGVMKAAQSYRAAGVEQVTVQLYEKARHELLNESQKFTVFHDICIWMENISEK